MISLKNVYEARNRIKPYIRRTPLFESTQLSKISKANVKLKMENLQLTGSFKPRGVTNKLLSLSQAQIKRGVIATSTGNHGRAVAYIAREVGGRAIICISEGVPDNKKEAIRELGAEIIVGGKNFDEALRAMEQIVKKQGVEPFNSFRDPYIMAGHATIGLELLEDFPEIDTVIIPVADGVLLVGIAVVLKAADPSVKVVGVSMKRGAALIPSLRAGKIVDFEEKPTLADAIMGGLGPDGEFILDTVNRYIDETIMVSEEEIAEAMTFALNEHHQVIEGAGAVGIAALLNQKVSGLGNNVAVVVTGGNVDTQTLLRIVQ